MTDLFKPVPPHEALSAMKALLGHPELLIPGLTEVIPQVVDGQIQYIFEGGVACHLLTRGLSQLPEDIDVIAINPSVTKVLSNTRAYDGKDYSRLPEYYRGLSPPFDPNQFVAGHCVSIQSSWVEEPLTIVSGEYLVVTKLLPWLNGRYNPRTKDLEDIQSLLPFLDDKQLQLTLNLVPMWNHIEPKVRGTLSGYVERGNASLSELIKLHHLLREAAVISI